MIEIRSIIHGTEAEVETDEAKETIRKHNQNFGTDEQPYVAGVKVTIDGEPVVVPHPEDIDNPDEPRILERLI
jgi:hypothetical protein